MQPVAACRRGMAMSILANVTSIPPMALGRAEFDAPPPPKTLLHAMEKCAGWCYCLEICRELRPQHVAHGPCGQDTLEF